ncbi:unnamed protein product [Lampetra planeri]
MSAEEDTELRDLLVQTLEGNGVLNKIKAELRAAVFLALEEQEAVQNKTPLVNEQLKNFLNSKDGLLIASLVTEFLQFFNLDFTLAVFTPETNTVIGLDDRGGLTQKLGIVETDSTKSAPLLLEILKRSRARGIRKGSFEVWMSRVDLPVQDKEGSTRMYVEFLSHPTLPTVLIGGAGEGQQTKHNKQSDKQSALYFYPSATAHHKTPDASLSDDSSSDGLRSKGPAVQSVPEVKATSAAGNGLHGGSSEQQTEPVAARAAGGADKLGEEDEDGEEYGDSFFDDLSPKPDKVYGRLPGLGRSSDSPLLEEDKDKQDSAADITATSHAADSPADDKKGESPHPSWKGEDYEDDFQSVSHRSDHTKTEESIAEEIDDLSIEAEPSDASAKVEDVTLDNTFCSQNSDKADYMEEAELSSTREG